MNPQRLDEAEEPRNYQSRESVCVCKREKMRIADVLRERDDGDDVGSSDHSLLSFTSKTYFASPIGTAASSPSSRSLLSRWFRNRRKRAPAASGGVLVAPLSTTDRVASEGVDSDRRLSEIDLCSGGKSNEMAFNLGMGIGMAFLLAGNTKEMNKMMELRKQMEMLLKEIKCEVRRRDDSSLCRASDVGVDAISTTISIQHQCSSLDMEEPKHFTDSDRKNYQSFENLRCLDELEEELQVELEQMQLNFDGQGVGQHNMELNSKKVDPSSGSSAPAWYDNMPDENSSERHGVCAYDLERRLHELVQTRQQERIEALESALGSAQRKLHEKEAELCCWKNIAELIPENEETYFSLSIK